MTLPQDSGRAAGPGPNPLAAGEDNISVDAAQATIHSALRPIADTEVVSLTKAIGRVVGEPFAFNE